MKIITIASNKGGATKTTAAANLGYYLGTKASTLIADFDSQGQLALWYGKDPMSSVFDWWSGSKILENAVVAAREIGQLWLLPGDTRSKLLEKLYRGLTAEQFQGFVRQVKRLGEHFEYVVIDTAPAGVLQEVAIAAASEIVVPFLPETAGMDGAFGTWEMLKEMRSQARITFLPSAFEEKRSEAARCLEEVIRYVGRENVAMPVLRRLSVTEALAEGCTVWEHDYARIEPVRDAYQALAMRLCGPFEADLVAEEAAWTHK